VSLQRDDAAVFQAWGKAEASFPWKLFQRQDWPVCGPPSGGTVHEPRFDEPSPLGVLRVLGAKTICIFLGAELKIMFYKIITLHRRSVMIL
jgi:hypothetical protein